MNSRTYKLDVRTKSQMLVNKETFVPSNSQKAGITAYLHVFVTPIQLSFKKNNQSL